jgi:hypothetical protein
MTQGKPMSKLTGTDGMKGCHWNVNPNCFNFCCGFYFLLHHHRNLFFRKLYSKVTEVMFAMVAGLTSYISMIQIILAAILALVMGKLMSDLSVATLVDADKSTIAGWLLGRLDPISIWAYAVIGIGLAKMFRAVSVVNYIAMVFLVWILGSLLFFAISKAVPFLSFING